MNESEIYNVLIVGAGPAGLTASLFAHNKNLRVIIVEGLNAGGQLKNLYPFKPVYNYPGYSQINAGKLADLMLQHVKEKSIPLLENESVQKISCLDNGGFLVITKNLRLEAQGIILACGLGLFEPRRLNVVGELELENHKVYYRLMEPDQWENSDVAIVGGGNSAVDNAMLLLEKKCRVSMIHQLQAFQAEPASVAKLKQQNADILWGWKVHKFEKSPKGKLHIFIQHVKTKKLKSIVKDRVLINIGLKPKVEFIEHLNLLKKGRRLQVDSEMRTSTAGIHACGDVVNYPGKVRLIVTAIGEAATSVNSLERYLKSKF